MNFVFLNSLNMLMDGYFEDSDKSICNNETYLDKK